MRKWDDYKKTFGDESIFDYARTGDLNGLASLLSGSAGLDLNERNHKGYGPLMLAIYNGQDIFAEALLRAGADINSCDYMGNTVAMGASFKGNVRMLELLDSYGADFKAKNNAGMNAYDWAKMFGRKNSLEFLRTKINDSESSLILSYFRFIKLCFGMIKKRG